MTGSRATQVALLILAAMLASGCARQQTAVVSPPPRSGSVAPHRIICLAPCITETVFAVGAGDSVVGVTNYCRYPAEVKKRKRVGGLLNPNFETMFALNPDLAIMLACEADMGRRLDARSIRCVTVRNENLTDIYSMIRQIGEATGRQQQADKLVKHTQDELRSLQAPPGAQRPTVLLSAEREPGAIKTVFAMGHGTFVDELLELVGGRNVISDSKVRYPEVSLESLIARDPDMIIELCSDDHMTASQRDALAGDWNRIPGLRAVKNHQVHVISANYLLVPGPRIVQTARTLRSILEKR